MSLKLQVYAPLISIFDANEEPDLVAFTKQVLRVASASVGLVINGSTAEAASLSNAERALFVKTARDALERAGLHTIPIIAGVGVGSTRESIELARQAHLAGADAVIAIPPSAYAAALNRDQDALCQYFADIAASSPLPVCAQRFVAQLTSQHGIQLPSDDWDRLEFRPPAQAGPDCAQRVRSQIHVRCIAASSIHSAAAPTSAR